MKYILMSLLAIFSGCSEMQQNTVVSKHATEAELTESKKSSEADLEQKSNASVSVIDKARRADNNKFAIVRIGYLNNMHAFREEITNNILLLNDDHNLILYKQGHPYVEPMFINKNGVIYKTKKENKSYLQIVTDQRTQNIPILFATNHVIATENLELVFYVEDGSDDTSALMLIDVDKQLQEKKANVAYYAEVIGDKIYFLQLTEEGYPKASIYSAAINNLSEKTLVLDDVFISNTHIFSDGSYIFTTKWLNGKKADIIYNYDIAKFAYIDASFTKDNYFAFVVKAASVGFYHPEKRIFKYADKPENLPYSYDISTKANRKTGR